MSQYRYSGLDAAGNSQAGVIDGDTITAAADKLRKQGVSITSLAENDVAVAEARGRSYDFLVMLSFVREPDIVMFFRMLASLLNSGVTIIGALAVLEKQTPNRRMRWMIGCMRRDVESGQPLSVAMAKFPRVFSEMVTSMVRSGEVGGIIEEMLERMASFMEERYEFRNQMISNMAYPLFVFCVTIMAVAFMAGFVIPRFLPFIQAQGGHLPWNTLLLKNMSELVSGHFQAGLYGISGAMLLVAIIYITPLGRRVIDTGRLYIPVIGTIFRYNVVVQFSRALSSLLGSGIPLVESLRVTKDTVSNVAAQRTVEDMIEDVLAGEPLSGSLEKATYLFPPMVGSMVKVGEETGSIEGALSQTAIIHEKMLRSRLKFLNAIVEPILILSVAGLVAFSAWAMLAGILSVYDAA